MILHKKIYNLMPLGPVTGPDCLNGKAREKEKDMGQQGGVGREPGRLATGLHDEPSGWWLGWLPPRCPAGRGSLGDVVELFLGLLQCGCE